MAKGFVVDLQKCIGCKACVAVCKIRYSSTEGVSRRRVLIKDTAGSRVFVSMACNHCEAPACMAACPKGAISKDSQGRVIHDKAKCVGCRRCEWACPYGAMWYDPSTQKVDKCDGCATKTDGPRCVEACHATALQWVDVDASFTTAAKQVVADGAELLPDPGLTNPNIRFDKFTGLT
ncbi:MAG: 4Fe-4S dicluster domain-containing protein [Coriobacteriia bacterium]